MEELCYFCCIYCIIMHIYIHLLYIYILHEIRRISDDISEQTRITTQNIFFNPGKIHNRNKSFQFILKLKLDALVIRQQAIFMKL